MRDEMERLRARAAELRAALEELGGMSPPPFDAAPLRARLAAQLARVENRIFNYRQAKLPLN